MSRCRGSLGPAARLLGISYKTLQYRLRKYELDREAFNGGESHGALAGAPEARRDDLK